MTKPLPCIMWMNYELCGNIVVSSLLFLKMDCSVLVLTPSINDNKINDKNEWSSLSKNNTLGTWYIIIIIITLSCVVWFRDVIHYSVHEVMRIESHFVFILQDFYTLGHPELLHHQDQYCYARDRVFVDN